MLRTALPVVEGSAVRVPAATNIGAGERPHVLARICVYSPSATTFAATPRPNPRDGGKGLYVHCTPSDRMQRSPAGIPGVQGRVILLSWDIT
jgi:hypothetical protein